MAMLICSQPYAVPTCRNGYMAVDGGNDNGVIGSIKILWAASPHQSEPNFRTVTSDAVGPDRIRQ